MLRPGVLLIGTLIAFGFGSVGRAVADVWSEVVPMTEPRAAATATVLKEGEVLIAGGYNLLTEGTDWKPSTELFDPDTRAWRPAAPMLAARVAPLAALLRDGRVLAVGVDAATSCCDQTVGAEIFDPTTDSWSTTSAPPEMRDVETITALPDGRALAIGHYGPPDSAPESWTIEAALYDPADSTWSPTQPPLATRDHGATATLLGTGEVLLAGGYEEKGFVTIPADHSYSLTYGHPNDTVLASAETYDPASGAWTAVARMLHPRTSQAATAMADGSALIAGGEEELDAPGTMTESDVQSSAEVFDPSTDEWQALPTMSFPRAYAEATTLSNGSVIIAGGGECSLAPGYSACLNRDAHSTYSSLCCAASTAEIYEPETGRWTVTGPVLAGDEAALAAVGNEALTAGGDLPLNDRELNTAFVYGAPPKPSSQTPTVVSKTTPPARHASESFKLKVLKRRTHGAWARLVVEVPSAGRLTATGRDIARAVKRTRHVRSLALRVSLKRRLRKALAHRARRGARVRVLKARVRLRFHGTDGRTAKATVIVTFA